MGWSFFTWLPSATRIFLIIPGNGDKTFSPSADIFGAVTGADETVFVSETTLDVSEPTSSTPT